MKPRQLLIIAAVIIALAVIGLAVYFLLFRQSGEITVGDPTDPFGGAGEYQGGVEAPPIGVGQEGAGEVVAPRLVKITNGPVAEGVAAFTIEIEVSPLPGATTSATTTIFDTEVRYVERASGNIYAYGVGGRVLTRLTNQTLPGVQEAHWTPDGTRAFVRFLPEEGVNVETFSLPADGTNGYFLESGLSGIAVTNNVLALRSNENGTVGTLATAAGANPQTLFSSLLSSITVQPAGAGYAAHTKGSAQMDGYGFLIRSGAFERILGPLRGLSLLASPSGTSLLYSAVSGRTLSLSVIDVATRESTSLPVNTLAEKCVWAADGSDVYCAVPQSLSGTLPDDWYQGAVSFSDRIWRINLEARIASMVFDPSTAADVTIDAVELTIDPRSDALVFTNRLDGSLWVYDF